MIDCKTTIEIITIFRNDSGEDYREPNDRGGHFADCNDIDGLVLCEREVVILLQVGCEGTRPVFLALFI